MKLLVIGPYQSMLAESAEGRARRALQEAQVERYVVYSPLSGESKLAAARRILRQTKQEEFDVVSAQDPFFVGLLAWRIARRGRARLNVQVHTDLTKQSLVRRVLAGVVLRHADSVRAASEKIKNQVLRAGAKAPVRVLPLYIDVERFRNLAREPEDGTILWIGRFEQEKDPFLALAIARQLPGTKLIMLGKGSLEHGLRAEAQGLAVEFPGWQDPAPFLSRASVVLCTSRYEGYGVSIIEALAAGVPVVAPDVGVAKEAGAVVVPREGLAAAVAQTLRAGAGGRLQLPLLNKEEWAQAWLKTL